MNIALLLSMLVQSGLCAPTTFHAADGTDLSVIVCPVLHTPTHDEKLKLEPLPGDPA